MKQPLAYVHPAAKIAPSVVIDPFVTIDANVEIGEGTRICSNVTILEQGLLPESSHAALCGRTDARACRRLLRQNCPPLLRLRAGCNVTILEGARIGRNCTIFPGAVIGAIPQDLKFRGEDTLAIIGDNTTIRECVTVNRGTAARGRTSVGNNCLIMAYSHVAHDCAVGDNVIISNATQLAGEVVVDSFAVPALWFFIRNRG